MAEKSSEPSGWIQTLKKDHLGKRLFIALCILLAFAIYIHFREVQVEVLELNHLAKNYVIAQVDFEFPDEEGTVILKQQSAQDIGVIYRLNPQFVEKKQLEFDNFLIQDQRWRHLLPNCTFEEMYQMGDRVKKMLIYARFSDQRTLGRLEVLKISKENYYVLPPSFEKNTVILPESFWKNIQRDVVGKSSPNRSMVAYVVDYFQNISWPLKQDTMTQRNLRKVVEASVPQKLKRIQAGSRIINRGERITAKHIAMTQFMKKAIAEGRRLWEPLPLLGGLIFGGDYHMSGDFLLSNESSRYPFFCAKDLSLCNYCFAYPVFVKGHRVFSP